MVDSSLQRLQSKVRRLTGSPSTRQLSDDDLNNYIDRFYESDLPAALKLWELKGNYDFYTTANEDRYELPVNIYQGVRNPVFVQQRQVSLYTDQGSFFSNYPNTADLDESNSGDGSAGPYALTLTNIPVTKREVLISAVDTNGDTVSIIDDGSGGFYEAGTTTAVPSATINYITGAITAYFYAGGAAKTIPSTSTISITTSPYVASRPAAMLYFNKYMYLRPIPDQAYKVTVQVYRRPYQLFEDSNGNHSADTEPDINQWFDLIALGASRKVLEDRRDDDGRARLEPNFIEQMDLALNRTIAENTQKRTQTVFSSYPGRYGQWPGAGYWVDGGL